MKCFPKQLTYAVNLFLFSFTFSFNLENLIKNELQKRFGDEVILESYKPLTQLPQDFTRLEMRVYRNSPRGLFFLKNGKIGTIALFLKWKCRVLIAVKDINPGERLNHSNTSWKEEYLKRCPKGFHEPIQNFVAKRFISKGSRISRSFLKKELLVKRGDIVRAFYIKGGVYIVFKTKSLDNGFWGDIVRIHSPFSKKIIKGKVVGEKEVKILD
ncbi:MAG TPA: flagellar basal body P-ring formation protein FlgA [Aquifex aeolicus]|nr:flagellar basal body P-ring formation protein FlgA [Aquifex aeolicus]